ncbi:MAG: hypothetical protein JW723_06520 [Bacteroidales bacterium]|nr:hypothetical protein [Bacteroidales bacterium]
MINFRLIISIFGISLYHTAIDWNAPGWSKENIDNTLYRWDGHNYSYYIGNSSLSINGGSPVIPPTSAFFVKAGTAGTLGITNQARKHLTTWNENHPMLGNYLKVSVTKNNYRDETLINFIPQASQDFDSEYDAHKLFSTVLNVPQVYSKSGTKLLAINSLPSDEASIIVPLSFKSGANGEYVLDFTDYVFSNVENLYIEDSRISNQLTAVYSKSNLLLPYYSFNYNTSDSPDRFALHFDIYPTGAKAMQDDFPLDIYSVGQTIYISLDYSGNNNPEYFIYNILGSLVAAGKLDPQSLNDIRVNKSYEYYIVKITAGNRVVTRKVFIN